MCVHVLFSINNQKKIMRKRETEKKERERETLFKIVLVVVVVMLPFPKSCRGYLSQAQCTDQVYETNSKMMQLTNRHGNFNTSINTKFPYLFFFVLLFKKKLIIVLFKMKKKYFFVLIIEVNDL